MIISIIAAIGSQNLGDELILKNEIKLLEKKYGKKTKFKVFSYDIENPFFEASNIEYREYFPIGIRNPTNFGKNIANFVSFLYTIFLSDLIVVGGGGIIYDHEIQTGNNPLNQWVFRSHIFRFMKKKVEYFRIGINIKNEHNYKKLQTIFSGNIEIIVRDTYSFNLLKKLSISSSIDYDPVFYEAGLPEEILKKQLILKQTSAKTLSNTVLKDIKLKGKKIGIALRFGFIKDEEQTIINLVNYIIQQGGIPIFIPHSFHKTDILANDFEFLKTFSFLHNSKIYTCMADSYNAYKNTEVDICIAMRLHSIILCQSYGIPFIAISYSKKTDEILKEITKK